MLSVKIAPVGQPAITCCFFRSNIPGSAKALMDDIMFDMKTKLFIIALTLSCSAAFADFRTWIDYQGLKKYAEWTKYTGAQDYVARRQWYGKDRNDWLYRQFIIQANQSIAQQPRAITAGYQNSDSGRRSTKAPESPEEMATRIVDSLPDKTWEKLAEFLAFLILTPFAITAAIILDKKRRRIHPDTLPYKWGYYLASLRLMTLPFAVWGIYDASQSSGRDSEMTMFWSMYGLVQGILSWFMIKRKRLAWILSIILAFNPLAWVINGIYVRHRWEEFRDEANAPRQTRRGIRRLRSTQRTIAAFTLSTVILFLGIGIMTFFDLTPFDLEETWFLWAIVVGVIGLANMALFKDHRDRT